MKKILSAAIALSMLLSFASCGKTQTSKPDEETPPQMPNGERPTRPNGSEADGNTPPEMPSGERPTDANGTAPDANENDTSKTVFNLNAGGNTYTVF